MHTSGVSRESINDVIWLLSRAPLFAVFLVTSSSLVSLYLIFWPESWAFIYLALSQASCDNACDQGQVAGGQ